jgi:thiamine kinase-like enzyme
MEFLEYHDDAKTSGSKFVADCKEITDANPTTKEWLNSITELKSISIEKSLKMTNKKILEGLLNKKKKVVIKIANVREDISHEWEIFLKLKKYRIPGILEHYCYFRCNDDIKRFVEGLDETPSLCNGKGDAIQVLIMKYIPDKSMKAFDWRTVPIDTLRSCMKQVILTLYEGYKKCYFRHGDLHTDNVLMKKTTLKEIYYETAGIRVPVFGYKILLMDFELSRLEDASVPPEKIFAELMFFLQKLNQFSLNFFESGKIDTFYNAVEKAKNNNAPIETLLSFLPLCDQMEYKKRMGGKLVCEGKRPKLRLNKYH